MANEKAIQGLQQLFIKFFSPDELRRFVAYGPNGSKLSGQLPGREVSLERLAEEVVDLLNKNGLIGPDLWARLKDARERRAAEVDALASLWTQQQLTPAGPASAPTAHAVAASAVEVVFAMALGLEYQAVREQLSGPISSQRLPSGTIVERGTIATSGRMVPVALVETGHGPEDAALVVSDVLQQLRPKTLVFVGVAGGLKDVKLGDVVVSDRVYAYEYGKEVESFKARPHLGNTAYRLLQQARHEVRNSGWLARAGYPSDSLQTPRAFIGPIAAGSKVVASQEATTARLVQEHYSDALAIEMEGYGALRASWFQNTEAIVIRGISDLLSKKSAADAEGWQERAVGHAAAFAVQMIVGLAS